MFNEQIFGVVCSADSDIVLSINEHMPQYSVSRNMSRRKFEHTIPMGLKRKKIFTTPQLVEVLGCSIATVRRRIKEWEAHTSYNGNGGYYALPDVARFDEYGVWECRKALFCKHGSLRASIEHLVSESEAGLSALEVGEMLRVPAQTIQTVLSAHMEQMATRREKIKGLNIYFSDKTGVFNKQRAAREVVLTKSAQLDIPSDAEAVVILVELIKHPGDTVERLVRRVRRRAVKVSIDKARNLLIYHGIKKNAWAKANKKR